MAATVEELKVVLSAVTTKFKQQMQNAKKAIHEIKDETKQTADAAAQAADEGTKAVLNKVGATVNRTKAEISSITESVKKAASETAQTAGSMARAVTKQTAGSLEELSQKTGKSVNELRSEALKLGASYQKMGIGKSDAMKKAYRDIGLVKDEVKSTEKQVSSSSGRIKKFLNSLVSSVKGNFKTLGTQADGLKSKLSSAFTAIKASALIIAIQKLTGVIKGCVDSYNTLTSSQQGLDSILSAQGKSVNQAKKWLEQYTKDGLISTADAYAAYKNLSSAGYSDDQTQSIMQNLKDSSAFNRQASLSMGEAVKSATEGIKNENSVLVDNAGVTKNLSVIWKEYAASIGKSVDSLTATEKRIATTQGLMRETAFQTGDAAKYADTLAGAMAALKAQTTSLSAAVGSAFAPVLKAVIPIITSVTAKLTELFNAIARITTALFGSAAGGAGVSQIASDAANATDSVNDTTAAVKELKRSAMGFDQLNILSDSNSEDTSSSTDAQTSASISTGSSSVSDANESLTLLDKLQNKMSELKNLAVKGFWTGLGNTSVFKSIQKEISGISSGFKKIATDSKVISSVGGYFNSMALNLGKVSGAVVSVGSTVVDNLFGGLEKYLAQNGEYLKERIISIFDVSGGIWNTIGNASAAFADIFSVFRSDDAKQITADIIAVFSNGFFGAVDLIQRLAGDILNCITTPFVENKDAIKSAIEGLLAPIQSITGGISGVVTNTFNTIFAAYDQYIKPAFDNITSGLSTIVETATSAFNTYFLPVFNNIATGFSDMMSNHIQPLIDSFIGFCGRIIEYISIVWEYLSPFLGWIAGNLVAGISTALNTIWNVISPIINYILDILSNLFDALSGILDFVIGVFTGDWKRAWNGIKTVVSSVLDNFRALFDMAKGLLLGIVKSLVTGINNSISNCVEGVKTLFSSAYERITTIWSGIAGFFGGVWAGIKNAFGNVADWFKNIFSEAWANVKNVFSTGGKIFSGIVDGIANTFKNIVNKIISGINNVISVPFKAINSMLKKLKSINILGVSPFGWVTEFKIPQIPQLAKGGIVDSPTAAVIGEAGKEAVMPLENNTGWIDNLAARISSSLGISENALYRAFARALAELPDEEILLILDNEIVARASEKGKKKLNRRYGKVEMGM